MTESGLTSGRNRCREELLTWLKAHTHWPLSVSLRLPGGELVAAMRGRLVATACPAVFEILTDNGSMHVAVPILVDSVTIDGSRSASFKRTDLPLAIVFAVDAS